MKYLSGRKKLRPFSGLSTSRYRYIGLDEVEPNLGYVNEKQLPVKDLYYQLVTFEGGNSFDRYWQAVPPVGVVTGISIFDEGLLVGVANTINKLNFVGAAITATASGSISTITVFAPGNSSELIFNDNSEFSTSPKFFIDKNTGALNVSNIFNVGVGGSIFVVGNTGKVGIGSSAPTQELDVNGNIKLKGTIYDYTNSPGNSGEILTKNIFDGVVWSSANSIRSGAGGTYTNIQYHNSAGLVDGVPFFVYNDINQRIGIGSTQPSTFLDVVGSTKFSQLEVTGFSTFRNEVRFFEPVFFNDNTVIQSNTDGTLLKLTLDAPSTNGYALVVEDRNPGAPDPTPFIIDRLGQVGIGTTAPKAPLNVVGITSLDRLQVTGISSFFAVARFYNNVNFYNNTAIEANTNGPLLRLTLGDPSTRGDALVVEDRNPGIGTDSSPFVINRIGQVGIGTTSPKAGKLNIQGGGIHLDNNNWLAFGYDNIALIRGADVTDPSGGYLGFRAGTYPDNSMILTGAGNLGIGTTDPGEKLNVGGNIRLGLSTTSNYIAFRGTTGDGVFNNDPANLYTHTFIGERIYNPSTQASELLIVKSNDYQDPPLGPDRIRLLAGELTFSTYTASTVWGTFEQIGSSNLPIPRITVKSDGNVGIATTLPRATLDVNGNAILAGITTQKLSSSTNPPQDSQMSFELTNNTTLTVRVRGTDGQVRTGTITLS